jgi:hypothetical protein
MIMFRWPPWPDRRKWGKYNRDSKSVEIGSFPGVLGGTEAFVEEFPKAKLSIRMSSKNCFTEIMG